MKEQYIITVERPRDVSVNEMKEYIKEAVQRWSGQYHPQDPLFKFSDNVHSVKRLAK